MAEDGVGAKRALGATALAGVLRDVVTWTLTVVDAVMLVAG